MAEKTKRKSANKLRNRFGAGLSKLKRKIKEATRVERFEVTKPTPQVGIDDTPSEKNTWSKQSTFRSLRELGGSSVVRVWFETNEDTGVRFTLDLATGVLSNRENWTPEVTMPGQAAIDPEPLSVWGVDSFDDRINIIMHVGSFDDLYVDGDPSELDDHPEVDALLTDLTNVAVRDMWIE